MDSKVQEFCETHGVKPPSEDGSCPCGSTVISTDGPCLFCGGYTLEQVRSAMSEEATCDAER